MTEIEALLSQDPRGLLVMDVATQDGMVEGIVDLRDVFLQLAALGRPIVTQWGTFVPTGQLPVAN
jgi:hypothetical protein